MRKKSRAMDSEWALEVMHKAPYMTVSFIDKDGKPYGLPLSLASDDDVNWYFHGALEGKKLEAIKAHPEVCLSAVTRCAPTVGPKDGSFTLQFKSAIAFGKAEIVTDEASVTNSTSVMMTTVAGDENAIGYISLGSLDDTVKAVKIDGVEATVDNVSNDSYKIARPFNILTSDKESDAAKDFVNYIMSSDGQKIVEDNGYIKEAADVKAYEAADGVSGKVVVAGSSSVTPVMEKLAEGYEAVNKDVTVEVQQSDSTTGVNMAAEGTADIGMASRDLKDEEKDLGLTATVIARDGIAVIVNKDNDIDELTSDQVKAVYTGETTTWEDLAK